MGGVHSEVTSMTAEEIKTQFSEYKPQVLSSNFADKTGKQYGHLTVLYRTYNLNERTRWVCQCECGNYTVVNGSSLHKRGTQTCGCKNFYINPNKKHNNYDLSGEYGIGYFLNTNNVFYFDIEDYDKIKKYCWFESQAGYALCFNQVGKSSLRQHRLIMNAQNGDVVDHINRKRFDNRKENLRIVDTQHNVFNHNLSYTNKSGITGVYWDNTKQRWTAQIKYNGQNHRKYFKNFEDAVKARLEMEIKYFGEDFAPQRDLFQKYNIL